MNRVETYKEKRNFKRKIGFVILLFVLFVFIGITEVDYSVNSLMKNEKQIEVVSLENKNDYYILDFMGKKLYFNTGRIMKDYEKAKSMITGK